MPISKLPVRAAPSDPVRIPWYVSTIGTVDASDRIAPPRPPMLMVSATPRARKLRLVILRPIPPSPIHIVAIRRAFRVPGSPSGP
jgi:hypothetical protein